MKKLKWLIVMLCAICSITLCMGIFTACNNNDKACTEHVDADGDGKCDNCGTDVSEPATEYKITDGVYTAQGDATHRLLIKFYEDGTFYCEGFMGNVVTGKYEVKDNVEVKCIDYQHEGDGIWCPIDPKLNPGYDITITTAVYFYEADGVTPVSMNIIPDHYPEGTAKNVVGFQNDILYHLCPDGLYSRALPHSPLNPFGPSDEKSVEKYNFMLKNEADIPEGAEEGAIVQDFTFKLTTKDFTSYILGEEVVGSYTLSNNVYALTNIITGKSYGTLTVSEDGESATYKNGDKTIELVKYVKAHGKVNEVASMTGDLWGMINFEFKYYDNFTAELFAVSGDKAVSLATVKWAIGSDNMSVVFSKSTNGTFQTSTLSSDYSKVNVAWTGAVTGLDGDQNITLECDASDLAALKEVKPAVNEVTNMTGDLWGMINFEFKYYDNFTAELFAVSGDKAVSLATVTWAIGSDNMSVVFSDSTNGTFQTSTLSSDYSKVTVAWTGAVTGLDGDQNITLECDASDLSALKEVKPAVNEVTSMTGDLWGMINFEFKYYDNFTAELFAVSGDKAVSLATVTWAIGSDNMSVVFSDSTNGTFQTSTLSSDYSKVTVAWTGAVTGLDGDQNVTFECDAGDLSALKAV